MKDNPFLVHAYVRQDNLCCSVITDQDYPTRAAQAFIQKALADVDRTTSGNWSRVNTDQTSTPGFLAQDIVTFQNPAAIDKLTAVQNQLNDIQNIMHNNIEEVYTSLFNQSYVLFNS